MVLLLQLMLLLLLQVLQVLLQPLAPLAPLALLARLVQDEGPLQQRPVPQQRLVSFVASDKVWVCHLPDLPAKLVPSAWRQMALLQLPHSLAVPQEVPALYLQWASPVPQKQPLLVQPV